MGTADIPSTVRLSDRAVSRADNVSDEAHPVRAVGIVGNEDMAQLPGGADAESKEAQRVHIYFLDASRTSSHIRQSVHTIV